MQGKEKIEYELDHNECRRVDNHNTPEQNLLTAIVLQALCDINKYKDRDTILWLLSEEDDPWCFRWVCEMTGLDAAYIRNCVAKNWPNKKKASYWRSIVMGRTGYK